MHFPGIDRDVRTLLLDIDGTLVDSNDAHACSWHEAFAEFGIAIPVDRIRPLIGMGADHLLPALRDDLRSDADPGKAISDRNRTIFIEKYLGSLRPTPGARELVAALKTAGVQLVVATSANQDEIDGLLDVADIHDLVDAVTTANDASSSKPAPDVVQAALGKARADPAAAAMLGDTRFDIEAAGRSRVPTVALRCGGAPESDLRTAAAVFDDPAALLRALVA